MPGFLKHGQLCTGLNKGFLKLSNSTIQLASQSSIDTLNGNITNINNEISSLKSSVSNGKSLIAAAVTDKGVPTAASDSFTTMSNNIRNIKQGLVIQYLGELSTEIPAVSINKTYNISGYITKAYTIYDKYQHYQNPFIKFINIRVNSPYWKTGEIILTLESGELLVYFTGGYGNGTFAIGYNRYLYIINDVTSDIKNELASSIGFNLYEIYFN